MSLSLLLILSFAYVGFLAVLMYLQKHGYISPTLASHPLVYCSATGVIASSWSFFGAIQLTNLYGYSFIAFYLGIASAFFISPILLQPFIRICREYQLSSLADLLAFRFHNRIIGTLVSLLLLIVTVGLLVTHIQTFTNSIVHLTTTNHHIIALIYCSLLALLGVFFVSYKRNYSNKHRPNLIVIVAAESLLKLVLFIILAVYLYFLIGDNNIALTIKSLEDNTWRSMLLLGFASIIVMPHIYHTLVGEHSNNNNLNYASCAAPLYLMIINLPIVLLFLLAEILGVSQESSFMMFALSAKLNNHTINVLSYMIGLTTVGCTVLVLVLSSALMLLNHVVLHFCKPDANKNIYIQLKTSKYLLIIGVVVISYMIYAAIYPHPNLYNYWFTWYALAVQLFPGTLSSLYWRKATSAGFMVGLITGCLVWLLGFAFTNNWQTVLYISLAANLGIFVVLSLIIKPNINEQKAALSCRADYYQLFNVRELQAQTANDFINYLKPRLGTALAISEVKNAAAEIKLDINEHNPYALYKLRHQLETNLARLFGQTVASEIIDAHIKFIERQETPINVNLLETHLESYQDKLSGLTAELDRLRRYQKQVLQHIPLGVCSINAANEITLWNKNIEKTTKISANYVVGKKIADLAEPWQQIISSFIKASSTSIFKQQINREYFNLYKAKLSSDNGLILVFENITEMQNLEKQLIHTDRLASIGRLAAGVAHEIGNPTTAIDCLAQNLAADYPDNPEICRITSQIQTQTKRIANIVQSLLSFSHADNNSANTAVNLYEISNQAIKLIQLNPTNKQIIFNNQCDTTHLVFGNAQKLLQVIINLLDNARFASPNRGNIWLQTKQLKQYIEFKISDEGTGIDAEIIDKLFEPFFTTKKAGQGTGLGLALTYTIVQEHQGNISIISPTNNRDKTGTCICIKLPSAKKSLK